MEAFVLALRYLRRRRVALVAVLSIAAGVTAMIVVVSLMDGVLVFLREHFRATQADLTVRHRETGTLVFSHAEAVRSALASEMEEAGGPVRALAPRCEARALLVPGREPTADEQDRIQGVKLVGIDFALERGVMPWPALLDGVLEPEFRVPQELHGDPFAPGPEPVLLLGDELARRLGVVGRGAPVGQGRVTVVTGTPKKGPDGKPVFDDTRTAACRVVGCYTTGRADFDRAFAYMDRRELLKLRFGDPDLGADATYVAVALVPGVSATEVARDLRLRHPELSVESWEEANQGELWAIEDQKRILVVILSFIVAVAAVAILGIVYLMVVEKTREIGVLRSLGLGRARLVLAFTVYGLLLGLIGAGLGLGVGLLAVRKIDTLVGWISDLTGVEILNAEIYRFETIPTRTEPLAVVQILATAVLMSLVAALLPALKAAFIAPVRCLRSD